MTITGAEALQAMLEHHRTLDEALKERVSALATSVAAGSPYEPAAAGLVAYLAGEVLPHAAAEERTIYRAAAARGDLADTVSEMAAEHRALSAAAERLAGARSGAAAAEQGERIAALFGAHVGKENEILLPALQADGKTDLAALLAEMHRLTGQDRQDGQPAPADEARATDPQAAVVSLLLEAAAALARAGQADRACRIAASAWAVLHGTRPDLAVRVTAAMHGLARRADRGVPGHSTGGGEPQGDRRSPGADRDLDVRHLAPAQRHETIFAAYEALAPGHVFVLVNDHDPKPLRYQFEAEHAGEFSWETVEAGPGVWRVRIGRAFPAAGTPGGGRSAASQDGGQEPEPELDVRVLAHAQRHDVIFTAYRALAPGAGFVLVNDHDPRPLHYQFEARYPAEFTWDYLKAGPKLWRVRIGRPGA